MKATCYHLRTTDGQKILGGTLGMRTPLDMNTAAARLAADLDVAVLPSGRVSFMRDGKPVWVYLSVDPTDTDKGRAALASDRQRRAALQADDDARRALLDDLIDRHGVDGAIARLRG